MKKYLIMALIVVMMFTQIVSAQTGGQAGGSAPCADPIINSITIVDELPAVKDGVQVYPDSSDSRCLGVLKCNAEPAAECELEGGAAMCQFNADGRDVGMETGTYCLNPSDEAVLCIFTAPDTGCDDSCEYAGNGMWQGPGLGGYTYDPNDGYKLGLKTVHVVVNITSPDSLEEICTGGSVKMTVDNYDLKMNKEVTLTPTSDNDCGNETYTGTWEGYFTMHYWEKPGWYKVIVEVVTCCDGGVKGNLNFDYLETPVLCIAPPGKMMEYTPLIQNKISYSIGDVNKSNCVQCDIGSAPQTIRNRGNALVNARVYSGDLACWSGACMAGKPDKIPAEIGNDEGRLYIDLGAGESKLWTTDKYIRMTAQDYCQQNITTGCPNCGTAMEAIYGLPPGPHATNILNLRVRVPNIRAGNYSQQITITPVVTARCCQDHREIDWTVTLPVCITPPECYEQNRYCTAIDTTPEACNQLASSPGTYKFPDNVCPGGIDHAVNEPKA